MCEILCIQFKVGEKLVRKNLYAYCASAFVCSDHPVGLLDLDYVPNLHQQRNANYDDDEEEDANWRRRTKIRRNQFYCGLWVVSVARLQNSTFVIFISSIAP